MFAAIINVFMGSYRRQLRLPGFPNRTLRLLLLLPLLALSCGSVFQGPVLGTLQLDRPADSADAVVFLRCRGSGLHGEIQTDAEHTRVSPGGQFAFIGSWTFPTTERCYIDVRHPRYLTKRVALDDVLAQKLDPVSLQSWDAFFQAGADYVVNPGTGRSWPESEVQRHLLDTLMWLHSFPVSGQREMARYVPDIHEIYRRAQVQLEGRAGNTREMLRRIGKIEEMTAYPFPLKDYIEAVNAGDAVKVQAFIKGGVLRQPGQNSMLYLASTLGHLEVMEVLLANGEPIDSPGCGAPVLGAIGNTQWDAALLLIRAGADTAVSCRNHRQLGDVLTDFARREQLELLAAFIDAGVPVDMRNSHNTTALADAAAEGRIEAVKLLLAAGANPDVRTGEGVALVDDALNKGYLDIRVELDRAGSAGQAGGPAQAFGGELISLPWRRGVPAHYRVHSSYGQVAQIAADPHTPGVLWLASAGGLLRYVPESGEQRAWTSGNGLPSSRVQNVWFDTAGAYLWLATPAGLARLPLDELERVETVGSGEPASSYSSGYLGRGQRGAPWFRGAGGLYRLEVEDSQARRYAFEQNIFGAVMMPAGPDLFFSDDSSVWRFNSTTGNRALLLDAPTLAAHISDGPPGLPQPRSLAVDAAQGQLWIGTRGHGVFRLDLDTGSLNQPELTAQQVSACASSPGAGGMHGVVMRVAGQTFARLGNCFGRIDRENRLQLLGEHIDAGPVADAAGDIWYLAAGVYHRLETTGEISQYSRVADPLGSSRVNAVFPRGGQLFVGTDDAPLAVLDLQRRTWSSLPRAANIQRLRSVAGTEDLLALGQSRYYWVDTAGLIVRELLLGPDTGGAIGGARWRDLRDLEFDGQEMWVLRNNRHRAAGKSRFGLYRLSAGGSRYYDSVSGYSLGELTAVVQDPAQAGRLWLRRKRDGALIDFDKASGASELARVSKPRSADQPLLASALAERRLRALTIGSREALDPDDPELTWGVFSTGVYLKRGSKIVQRWPATLPPGPIAVTHGQVTTVWIASSEGLIEYPLTDVQLQADSPEAPTVVGRRPR
jgi:uncharacterized protein